MQHGGPQGFPERLRPHLTRGFQEPRAPTSVCVPTRLRLRYESAALRTLVGCCADWLVTKYLPGIRCDRKVFRDSAAGPARQLGSLQHLHASKNHSMMFCKPLRVAGRLLGVLRRCALLHRRSHASGHVPRQRIPSTTLVIADQPLGIGHPRYSRRSVAFGRVL